MTPVLPLAAALLLALLVCAPPVLSAGVTIQTDKPGAPVSPLMWGIFFEEINHAGDGGLYAELIRNRGFEDAATPDNWEPVGAAALSLDTASPLTEATPHSLRVEARSAGDGVATQGYWGIAVREGASYKLSLHARATGEAGALTVSLQGKDGVVYASQTLQPAAATWTALRATLTSSATDPAARLAITASAPGTFGLDMVSLFPAETWKDRPNGLRPDLAGMLDGLSPAFVRFPGGCFVEGDQLANAFRWKTTIGDLAQRPGHWNLWGHRSTDGLGLHEYLQACEDLRAEPLFVINCGMAHGGVVPMDQMGEWVQDALDAIEYANGSTRTKWGALRASNGHPKPFNLRLMEIGNENGGPAYDERYALFYDAIKARYPKMRLIANVPVTSRPMDILDEHYYSSPEWFASQASRYDNYPRQGHKIYVGEYACTQGCGQGNLRAALGEAAFMTGMERNADLITMTSYAPLFVNVNNRAWNPDMIVFDSARCFGTPSYWTQKLFSDHPGDHVLPTQVDVAPLPVDIKGGIGLGTWVTTAEFRDLRVTSGDRVLYTDDFAAGAPGWQVLKGDFKATGDIYRQSSSDIDVRAFAGDPAWTDYTYSLKARKLSGGEGFLIMFHVEDADNWLWLNLGGWGNVRHAIEKCHAGGKSILGPQVPGSIETGRWYDIRIELKGSLIRCFLDGELIIEARDAQMQPLSVSATRDDATGEVIVKAVNITESSIRTTVRLEGLPNGWGAGRAITLTSASPLDENSLDDPLRVSPRERSLRCRLPEFSHRFGAHSLTVLRIRPDK